MFFVSPDTSKHLTIGYLRDTCNFDREDHYGIMLEGSSVSILDSPHTAMNPDYPKKSLYIGIQFSGNPYKSTMTSSDSSSL